jgi:hypothetical protein
MTVTIAAGIADLPTAKAATIDVVATDGDTAAVPGNFAARLAMETAPPTANIPIPATGTAVGTGAVSPQITAAPAAAGTVNVDALDVDASADVAPEMVGAATDTPVSLMDRLRSVLITTPVMVAAAVPLAPVARSATIATGATAHRPAKEDATAAATAESTGPSDPAPIAAAFMTSVAAVTIAASVQPPIGQRAKLPKADAAAAVPTFVATAPSQPIPMAVVSASVEPPPAPVATTPAPVADAGIPAASFSVSARPSVVPLSAQTTVDPGRMANASIAIASRFQVTSGRHAEAPAARTILDPGASPVMAAMTPAAPTLAPDNASGTASARAPADTGVTSAVDVATNALGPVSVGIHASGPGGDGAVRVHFAVDGGQTASAITDARADLDRALGASGVRLDGLTVQVRGVQSADGAQNDSRGSGIPAQDGGASAQGGDASGQGSASRGDDPSQPRRGSSPQHTDARGAPVQPSSPSINLRTANRLTRDRFA